MWQTALSHYIDNRTLSYALMVVARESLKPSGEQYEKHNISHVVEALVGKAAAQLLQRFPNEFRPQNVRGAVLHLGEFRASEFIESMAMSSYSDPTFDQAYRELWKISQATIIEWLSKSGVISSPTRKERKSFKMWVKGNIYFAMLFCIRIGIVIGWLVQVFWTR